MEELKIEGSAFDNLREGSDTIMIDGPEQVSMFDD